MAITVPNLGLTVWNAPTDPYVSAQLAENWYRIDEHDHSPGKGRALSGVSFTGGGVSTAVLVDGAVTTVKLGDGSVTAPKLATGAVTLLKTATGSNGLAAGCFSAYRNAALNSPAASTAVITFDAEEFDVSGWYDTATGRFTPQSPGYYRLNAAVRLASVAAGTGWRLQIAKNGTAFRELLGQYRVTTASQPISVGGSTIVQANGTTDYFTVILESTDGAQAITVAARYTYFQGELVGLS